MELIRWIYAVLLMAEYLIGLSMFFPEMLSACQTKKKQICFWCISVFVSGLYAYNGNLARISALLVSILPAIAAVLYSIFLKYNFLTVFSWNGLYIGVISLIKLLELIVQGLYQGKNINEVNYAAVTEKVVFFEIIILLFLWLCWNKIKKSKIELRVICKKNRWAFVAIVMMISGMMCYIMPLGHLTMNNQMLVLTLGSIVVIILLGAVFLYQTFVSQIQAERKMLYLRQERISMSMKLMKNNYDRIAKINHDIKHERRYLCQCILNHDYDKALNFLRNKEQVDFVTDIWTGNNALDFAINIYKSEMDSKGIAFSFKSDYTLLPIPEDDFMIILGLSLIHISEPTRP